MGVFVLIVAGLIVALTNENFAVTRWLTTRSGPEHVARQKCAGPVSSKGRTFFRIQPGQVAKNVKQLPRVADASIHVWLPGADRD